MVLLIGYLVIINIIGFLAMGIDKTRAQQHQWRIPERTLFVLALFGGSLGTWCGMYLFHHKTKHWYFVIGMSTILILDVILLVMYILRYGG